MCIGKSVDSPVKINPFDDSGGVACKMIAPYVIGDKVTNQQIVIIT